MRRGLLCRLANGERFLVDKDPFVIGRVRAADLMIPDGSISRRHLLFTRKDDRWWLADAGSTSGIDIRGYRLTEPVAVEVGMKFQFGGGHSVEILDLDFEAPPGELWPGTLRRLRFTCERLHCHAYVRTSSLTRNDALTSATDAMLVGTGGAIAGDTITFTEPGELIFALQRLEEQLEARERTRQFGDIAIAHRIESITIGSAALELLTEPRLPALAAWKWLTRNELLHLDPVLLRGLAIHMDHLRQDAIREELLASFDAPGAGIRLWIWDGQHGYLYWITERGEIISRNRRNDVVKITVERDATGWLARWDNEHARLDPGLNVVVGYAHELRVV